MIEEDLHYSNIICILQTEIKNTDNYVYTHSRPSINILYYSDNRRNNKMDKQYRLRISCMPQGF